MVNKQLDKRDPFNTSRPVVYKLSGPQWLVFYPLAWILWLYFRSLRIRAETAEQAGLAAIPNPRMVIMWHNRSLVSCEVIRRLMRIEQFSALISPSRMAAWEVALFEFMKMKVIRGSTTRRSIQAGIEILRLLRQGGDVGISPDGPSGPLYSFQSGAVKLARSAGVPVVVLVPNCRFARRLRTWDRHLVPYPFAEVRVRIRVIATNDRVWELPDEEAAQEIKRVCLEMTEDPF